MDTLVLTSPQGSVYNLGSWLRADPGPDFGEKDLLKAFYAETPAAEGGQYAFESIGVRRMGFPLMLASGGAAMSLGQLQGALRVAARPGATLDVLVDGEPTANSIRFDVLAGRLEPEYQLPLQRADRLLANLKLDTGPLGYLATVIVLASAASVGLPGTLAIPNASLLGDAPGLVELVIDATSATYYPAGSWAPDFLAWSIAGGSGASSFFTGASLASLAAASVVGDAFAPASQRLDAFLNGQTGWGKVGYVSLGSAIAARYTGRHRVFALAKLTPSQAMPWYLSADSGYLDAVSLAALASAQPVATLAPAIASGSPGAFGAQASPGFQLVDLGEITVPAAGSGLAPAQYIRLWTSPASSGGNVATPIVSIAGVFLHALDGPNGLLPRGLAFPTITAAASVSRLAVDAVGGNALLKPFGGTAALQDARLHYRGVLPLAGASTTHLDLLGAHRKVVAGATDPVVYAGPGFAKVSVLYRPRFQFLRSI